MEHLTTNNDISVLCRVCLTFSKNSVHLATPLDEKILDWPEGSSIHSLLETVTSHKVPSDDNKFPSKICQMCLSYLKISFEFQTQFKRSQKQLKSTPTSGPPVEVELICGSTKFDLNDVVLVEEEEDDKASFDGFLRNLGSEISAKFVNKNRPLVKPQTRVECIIEPTKPTSTRLDFSKLKVTKYPEDSTIVIEEINEQTTRVVKVIHRCPKCKEDFPSKDHLESHLEVKHFTTEPLICHKCGHVAYTKSQLYHHLKKHEGKPYKCDFCGKQYDTTSHLKIHLDSHKNERRFLCNVCGKSFNYSISLKYHLRLHADKEFVCNICGLRFRMPNTLKRHIRTHTKDKPYPCDYCEKRFPSRGEKLAHEMIHTGEKPYRCEYCGKEFAKAVNLQTHQLSHPGPHQCHICTKTFLEIKFLKVHIRRVHKDYEIVEIVES